MVEVKAGGATAECVQQVIKKRRSTRHFSDEPVSQDVLLELVDAGVQAPSGSNTQCQRFLIISDPEEIVSLDSVRFVWPYKSSRKRIKEEDRRGILANAAALILVFSDNSLTERSRGSEYHIWQALDIQNSSAAIENILIMATALGLGSCWVSATEGMNHSRLLSFRSWRDALAEYDIPPEYSIQGIILIGHPKTRDSDGFPTGERMHGLDWSPTDRQPVEEYLIQKGLSSKNDALHWQEEKKLRLLRGSVRVLLKIIGHLNRRISGMELHAVERWRQARER